VNLAFEGCFSFGSEHALNVKAVLRNAEDLGPRKSSRKQSIPYAREAVQSARRCARHNFQAGKREDEEAQRNARADAERAARQNLNKAAQHHRSG